MSFTYKNYEESDAVKNARDKASQYTDYNESDSVKNARAAYQNHEANKVADWTGGTYGQTVKDTMNKINNREKFTYDLNADALYQQYKNQYMTQGKLAMLDTVGQASANTGGYSNSYAVTAGNQAYQSYLQNLNDVVPELYQLAYDKYNQEGTDLYNQLSMYQNAYDTEYGEHRDKVSDWNTEADRLYNQYYNEANMDYNRFSDNRTYYNDAYNTERNWDYGLYTDAYNRAFQEYQQAYEEEQDALSRASSGSSGSYYYDDGGTYDYTIDDLAEAIGNDLSEQSSSQYSKDYISRLNEWSSTLKNDYGFTGAETGQIIKAAQESYLSQNSTANAVAQRKAARDAKKM